MYKRKHGKQNHCFLVHEKKFLKFFKKYSTVKKIRSPIKSRRFCLNSHRESIMFGSLFVKFYGNFSESGNFWACYLPTTCRGKSKRRVSRLLTVESALWHFPYPASPFRQICHRSNKKFWWNFWFRGYDFAWKSPFLVKGYRKRHSRRRKVRVRGKQNFEEFCV